MYIFLLALLISLNGTLYKVDASLSLILNLDTTSQNMENPTNDVSTFTLMGVFSMLNKELNKISTRLSAVETAVTDIRKMQRVNDNPYRLNHPTFTKSFKYEFGHFVTYTGYKYLVLQITLSSGSQRQHKAPSVNEHVLRYTRSLLTPEVYLILACDFYECADDICVKVLDMLGLEGADVDKVCFYKNCLTKEEADTTFYYLLNNT